MNAVKKHNPRRYKVSEPNPLLRPVWRITPDMEIEACRIGDFEGFFDKGLRVSGRDFFQGRRLVARFDTWQQAEWALMEEQARAVWNNGEEMLYATEAEAEADLIRIREGMEELTEEELAELAVWP